MRWFKLVDISKKSKILEHVPDEDWKRDSLEAKMSQMGLGWVCLAMMQNMY